MTSPSMTIDPVETPIRTAQTVSDTVRDAGGVAAAITAMLLLIGVLVRVIRKGFVALSHGAETYETLVGNDEHVGLDARTRVLEDQQEQMLAELDSIRRWQQEANGIHDAQYEQLAKQTEQLTQLNRQIAEVFETKEKP